MAFSNPVVGGEGGELVRDSIKSRNFQTGVSGWIIRRDGSAEFNNVLIRGGLIVTGDAQSANFVAGVSGWRLRSTGEAEFNGNATINNGTLTGGIIQTATSGERIVLSIIAGTPTIEFYDGTNPLPATISAYNLGSNGGLQISTGDVTVESTALFIAGDIAGISYDNQGGNLESAFMNVGPPGNQIIKLRATSAASQDLEFGFDLISTTPDLFPGRLYTNGEIFNNALALDANYSTRTVDGKVYSGVNQTTALATTDTNIAGANAVNVYVEDGYVYYVIVNIDYRNNNAAGRIDWKLWDGTPGVGTQLGGTNRRWSNNTTATNFEGQILTFIFRQFGTGIIGNMNLSGAKTVVTAAVAEAQVNAAYSMIVMKSGDANMIGNL